jgi:hypothetical protein
VSERVELETPATPRADLAEFFLRDVPRRRLGTMGAAALLVVCVVCVVCVAAPAKAGEKTSSLSWVELPGAEACGGAAAIARAVEQHLGRSALVSPAKADFSIEGHAERLGARLHAVLVLRDATGAQLGVRELESDDPGCGELRGNVALAVALMIDPDAMLRAPSERAPAPPPPPVVVERVEVPVVVAPPTPWQVAPMASAAIGYGFMPSVAWGALVSATLFPPSFWPVELYGGVWAPQSVSSRPGASTRFTSAFGGIGLCPVHVRGESLTFQLCAATQVGFIDSEPLGFASAKGGSLPTVHLVAEAQMSLALASGVAVRVGASLAAALLRGDFVFDDSAGSQSLFEAPVLAATAELGVAVTLP